MKILVSRLSAMGDVAMLLPVLYAVARANPEHEFTLLTQPFLGNLLLSPPDNLEAMAIDTKGEERSVWGLLRYVERLREEGFDLYLDLHDVLRTKCIRWLLRCAGVRSLHLQKPRAARKRHLSRAEGERPEPIEPTYRLYLRVFAEAGLRVPDTIDPIELTPEAIQPELRRSYPEAFDGTWVIGVAPFASTESKTYDLAQTEAVVAGLAERGYTVYLFGGRGREAAVLEGWAERYAGVYALAGRLELIDELAIISKLGLMLSMDSANMHLASMMGVRVLSVWCATHPSAGFLGIGQSEADCIQDEALGCRPCSIFGQVKRCVYRDMPCRRSLGSEAIISRILSLAPEKPKQEDKAE